MIKEHPLTVERIDFLISNYLQQIELMKKQSADSIWKTEQVINRLRINRLEIEGKNES